LDRSRGNGDQIETRVFALKYESAAQLVQVLRPLIAPNNTITAYQNNNTLVITDYASNLQRIAKIINSIDLASGTEPIIIPLRYASAIDLAQTVNRLFAESAGGNSDNSQRIIVEPDTRTNSLLARSDNPSRVTRLRSLVDMLDTPTSAAGNIHVVYLKNAEATKVAETLRAIFSGETTSSSASSNNSANNSTNASASSGTSASTTSPATSALNSASTSTNASRSGMIQADAATNSIIITAPDAIYNNLRAVLDKIDVRRAQVYVEALIAEITSDKAAEFGIQWQSLSGAGSTSTAARAFGGTNFGTTGNINSVAADPTTASPGLNIGVLKGRVTLPGVGEILNLGVLVHALQSDNTANILSTPTLLTLDNEEARIVVGQNVPFITGQYAVTGSATTASPFQTIERKDVGLTLRIKPQISEGGIVRMQIYQEVSSVLSTSASAGVTTNKRSIESTVLVDDGQIVVIGGLMQDSIKDGEDKTPLLGDIPILGNLFKSKSRSRNKTNLMVFLRPVVLRDADKANSVTTERYDYIRGEQRKVQPASSFALPNVESPTLPQRPPQAPAQNTPPATPQAQ
jgi:general secretion pathway protein D